MNYLKSGVPIGKSLFYYGKITVEEIKKMNTQKLTNEEFLNKLNCTNQYVVNGDIKILSPYVNSYSEVQCMCTKCGHIFWRTPTNLYKNSGCPECLRRSKFLTDEEFTLRLAEMNNGIVALDKYVGSYEKMRFQCHNKHIWLSRPYSVLNGQGCPYCDGKKVWIGFNDMWTTRPDVAKLLKNPKDGYKYTCSSGVLLEFVCPDCGTVRKRKPCTVSYYGLTCQVCSDSISYPNKFGRAFLKQLPIKNHQCEYQPEWAKPYFYDNYFEYNGNKYILEMDGGFHYLPNKSPSQTLENRQVVDKLKTEMAINHNINIVRIECLISECDYIKANIYKSELSKIFNLSMIDWELCDISAQKNLVKEACKLYNSGIHSTSQIGDILYISTGTVYKYLKNGVKFGWCNYNPKHSKKLTTQQND